MPMAAAQPTHAEIMTRLDRGNDRFARIEESQSEMLTEVREMRHQFEAAMRQLEEQTREIAKTREIVEAWGAVKTAGRFIKWLGGIIAALGAIYAAVRIDMTIIGK